jgi:xanthine dehydrogenase YagR molybdenum-binding subunit
MTSTIPGRDTVTTPAGTPIHPQFRIIDGLSILAADLKVSERVPFVREALLAGASPQLRNMTTIGGNLLQVHAALVQSTIAAGTISRISTEEAEAAPGVLAVITHENAPALPDGPMTPLGPSPRFPLRDNRILHHGQHVAIVVAQTHEQAAAAARLVKIDYEETAPVLGIDNPRAPVSRNP